MTPEVFGYRRALQGKESQLPLARKAFAAVIIN